MLTLQALDVPFLLLPFRPSSDPSAARTFVRNFFYPPQERERLRGSALEHDIRVTEVMVCLDSPASGRFMLTASTGLDQCS